MIVEKSKVPLNLMEQVVMILVFAFAAALCVQAFVLADSMSSETYSRDKAAIISQTLAETAKSQKGDWEKIISFMGGYETENGLLLYYNEEWEICDKRNGRYVAEIAVTETEAYLSKAQIVVMEIDSEETIFGLPVSWQEVADDE